MIIASLKNVLLKAQSNVNEPLRQRVSLQRKLLLRLRKRLENKVNLILEYFPVRALTKIN